MPEATTEDELRRTLARVVRAKETWELAVDSLVDVVLIVDRDVRVSRANRAVESWGLGTVRSVVGKDLHELLHPGCREATCHVSALWDRATRSHGAAEYEVTDVPLKRRLHVTVRAIGSSDADGSPDQAALVLRDISERHEQQEIRRRQDRFEAMGYLVGGLAHEIGNPIAAMKTTAEVWRRRFDECDRETHLRYLDRLSDGVDRLHATVSRILRPEENAPKMGPVAVADLLERTRRLFEDLAGERGLDLVAESGEPIRLSGNASSVEAILANVVKNALEACGRGDRVVIESDAQEDEVIIRVHDTGRGMNSAQKQKLFMPFFTTKATGTGIGLAHVNQQMEEMGGKIDISSEENVGTSVNLRFRRWGTS